MTYILSVVNQKGGVGKTTTVHAIGSKLHQEGKKVLFVDFDPQCNLSLSVDALTESSGSHAVFEDTPIKNEIISTPFGDILPSSQYLMVDAGKTGQGTDKLLKNALKTVSKDYDVIVIDTPPAFNTLTVNALSASDGVVIMAQADILSLQGIGNLSKSIKSVQKANNKNLEILGILISRFNKRGSLNQHIAKMLEDTAKTLGTKLYKTPIRESIAIREAQAMRKDYFSHAPKANATVDYIEFINELKRDIKKGLAK